MEIFILLDRSGSMNSRWTEAISSINGYVEEVQKAAGMELLTDSDRVTVAAFDRLHAGLDFRVLRDGQRLRAWQPLEDGEVTPRGNTPLLDAVVRIGSMAESRSAERTVLVIMTDGKENASVEASKDAAQAAIKRLQCRGWQVVYLGADFDAFEQAQQLGIAPARTLSMASGRYGEAMASVADYSSAYASSGQPVEFTAKDRAESGEDDVTKRNR